ncbi:MAG: InlB B-repeat-containing protein [Bacteroidales bacterium]|nr:InlB B-repeat-containing protein [Bacteroidales bacterium]
MKRINIFLLSALVFALTFTSCNKHDDDKAEPEKTTVENNSGNDNTEVTPEKVTVTFDILGGTGTAEPQTVEKGTKITLPSGDGMKKDGYKFLGWSLTENGEIITEYTATENEVKFFAIWVKVFTVKFDTDGGTGEFTAQTIEKGKTATEPEIRPSKGGFKFLGWYAGDTKFDFSTPIAAEVALKAKYEYAKFSVTADGKQVAFSGGNLQYNTETEKFQFAEHQYDRIGNGGANSGETGIRDLFGWGTWLEGGKPMNNSTTNDDYTWDDTKKSAIDKEGEEWVTLTYDEWMYLKGRNGKTKIGVAAVDGKQGLVILPDDWNFNGVTFNSGFSANAGPEYYQAVNNYTIDDWNKMEANGAVFLPAAGYRLGSVVCSVGDYGCYWSEGAYFMTFNSFGAALDFYYSYGGATYVGLSVRLVRVLQN